MTEKKEILVEGEYDYLNKNQLYCQESFKLVKSSETDHHVLFSEIFSRVDTGELLKVNVRYEMNQYFYPVHVKISRAIGKKFAQEIFDLDVSAQTLHYNFKNDSMSQDFIMPAANKHYIASPAFATTALFTLTKKFDSTGRTAVAIISSDNIWSYEGPPMDRVIYADFKTHELSDYKLNHTELSAMLLHLYKGDSTGIYHDEPVQLYLSKHYNLPYQLIQGDQQIVVKSLKKST